MPLAVELPVLYPKLPSVGSAKIRKDRKKSERELGKIISHRGTETQSGEEVIWRWGSAPCPEYR
jgi:hypothetical protein